MATQEQVKGFMEFNCVFCKNQESCHLYQFLKKPEVIVGMVIPDGKYECSFRYRERGVQIVSTETEIGL